MVACRSAPLRRIVVSEHDGELVAELRDRTLTLRRRRGRAGSPSTVVMTWGQLYLHGIIAKLEEERRPKGRRGRRVR